MRVLDGAVVRMPKAYPVYDDGFVPALDVVRRYLDGFTNFQAAGRNGMHKYNNQDHSMVTAILAAQNLLGARHDVWAVNADDEHTKKADWTSRRCRKNYWRCTRRSRRCRWSCPGWRKREGGGR